MPNDKPTDNADAALFRCAEIKEEVAELLDEYLKLLPKAIVRMTEFASQKQKAYTIDIEGKGKFTVNFEKHETT